MNIDRMPELEKSLLVATESLDKAKTAWLLGGSCGLLLQGVKLDKAPRDIDIYTDAESVHKLHHELNLWAEDSPHLDEEGMYKSVLSHYVIADYPVELVGGFEIASLGSQYKVKVSSLLYDRAPVYTLQHKPIRLMPLSHELVFNVLRNRRDRYEAIAKEIRRKPELHLDLLNTILSHNKWDASHLTIIQQLTSFS
ncbi:nucleotidyltransferase domain-containing protein [Paenibacillus dakarensis]|uniref:nucleotidyltransferase domain-containing protein n=1 Tax=Paenibacillus dakarensis TaxID=1527293 RepID=UPI0006D53B61|nr:hypothetical protein [Paenibacillus dakarensis]